MVSKYHITFCAFLKRFFSSSISASFSFNWSFNNTHLSHLKPAKNWAFWITAGATYAQELQEVDSATADSNVAIDWLVGHWIRHICVKLIKSLKFNVTVDGIVCLICERFKFCRYCIFFQFIFIWVYKTFVFEVFWTNMSIQFFAAFNTKEQVPFFWYFSYFWKSDENSEFFFWINKCSSQNLYMNALKNVPEHSNSLICTSTKILAWSHATIQYPYGNCST